MVKQKRKVYYIEKEHERAVVEAAGRLKESTSSRNRIGFESRIIRELIETLPTFKSKT